MNVLNEFSQIKEVALRSPLSGFIDDKKLSTEKKIPMAAAITPPSAALIHRL